MRDALPRGCVGLARPVQQGQYGHEKDVKKVAELGVLDQRREARQLFEHSDRFLCARASRRFTVDDANLAKSEHRQHCGENEQVPQRAVLHVLQEMRQATVAAQRAQQLRQGIGRGRPGVGGDQRGDQFGVQRRGGINPG